MILAMLLKCMKSTQTMPFTSYKLGCRELSKADSPRSLHYLIARSAPDVIVRIMEQTLLGCKVQMRR